MSKVQSFKFNKKRILTDIENVNREFNNLRTYITSADQDIFDLFYFVIIPADGTFSDKPLVGKMFFVKPYPDYPPVLHLFNYTQRYNLDVYHQLEDSRTDHSSLCLDILEKEGECANGIWRSDFSLMSIFASLLQVIVSYKVKQKYSDQEIEEFITMDKILAQHKQADQIWNRYKKFFINKLPDIPRVDAKRIKVNDRINFNVENMPISFEKGKKVLTSNGFLIDEADFSIVVDLTDLKKLKHEDHKHNFLVSFILTNAPRDLVGREPETILIRNSTSGTAAKKAKYGETKCFYHGKPLIELDKIILTISNQQFTLVIEDDELTSTKQETKNHKLYGDSILSYLTPSQLGYYGPTELFYLNIFVETKNTININNINNNNNSSNGNNKNNEISNKIEKLFIRLNVQNRFGFVQPSSGLERSTNKNHKTTNIKYPKLKIDLSLFKDKILIINENNSEVLARLIKEWENEAIQIRKNFDITNNNNSNKLTDLIKSSLVVNDNQLITSMDFIELDLRNVVYLKCLINIWKCIYFKKLKELKISNFLTTNKIIPVQNQLQSQLQSQSSGTKLSCVNYNNNNNNNNLNTDYSKYDSNKKMILNSKVNMDENTTPAQFWSKFNKNTMNNTELDQDDNKRDLNQFDYNESNNYDNQSYETSATDISVCISSFFENDYNIQSLLKANALRILNLSATNKRYDYDSLKNVLYVGIDLNQNSYMIYRDVLSMDNKINLLNKFQNKVLPGHVTLGFNNDFTTKEDFYEFLQDFIEDQIVQFEIYAFVYDQNAGVLLVNSKNVEFKFYSPNKPLNITCLLNNNTKPVYSNSLIQKLKIENNNLTNVIEKVESKKSASGNLYLKILDKPLKCLGKIKFYRKKN